METADRADEQLETRAADWTRADWIAVTIVSVIAAFLRLVRLSNPAELVFDEVYYAKDACFYVHSAASMCDTTTEITGVHPPLGKWMIAIGVRIFGYDSFGWRIAAAVVGTVTVVLLYLLARKVLRSTLGATIAAGLLAIDLLHLVQSRVAMLDIFVPFFGIAALYLMVLDRDRRTRIEQRPRRLDRPWLLVAGVMAGAATASKWSGGVFLLLCLVLAVVWAFEDDRDETGARSLRRVLASDGAAIVLYLLVTPLLLYMLTYAGRIDGATLLAAPWAEESWFRHFWDKQTGMLDFHRNLVSTHSYQSPPWSWILLKRPVSYFFQTGESGEYREIFAAGSPFVWWSSVLAIAYAGVRWARRHDPRGPEGLILAGFFYTYAPWLLLGAFSERSAVFIFYLVPTVPFMCLALGYVATRIGDSWEAKAAIGLFSVGAVGLFLFYLPLVIGTSLPQPQWQSRIWIFDDCDKPPPIEEEATVTETTTAGAEIIRTTTTETDASLPPTGWCWI